jgi:hypothetical protein
VKFLKNIGGKRLLGVLAAFVLAKMAFGQVREMDGWRQLVPSQAMPAGLHCMDGNNNLDLAHFNGRFYFAFRTAPSHFASKKTEIHLLSTADRKTWRLEKSFQLGTDMREPRFCSTDSALYFFFFEGGKRPLKFEPQKLWACHLDKSGHWHERKDLNMDGFVPWRIRSHQGRMYMSAYDGRNLYNRKHKANLRLFVSENGYEWQPLSAHPQTGEMGGEEGEFIFDDAGNLWATIRLEGAGSLLAFAPKEDLSNWQTFPSRAKYDSALLFKHQGQIYLISRRNLDGDAEKGKLLPPRLRRNYNLARYSLTRKCTALWLIDQANKEILHLIDFPSTGDTAFPAIVQLDANTFWLMNYSSRIDGPQKNWIRGQLGKTYIYETELRMR